MNSTIFLRRLFPSMVLAAFVGCATGSRSSESTSHHASRERLPGVPGSPAAVQNDAAVLKQLQLLNQVPEADLNEKTDPGFSIIKSIYDLDSPDFLTLRRLLAQASVRGSLNPSARCMLAGVVSQRWDTFSLSGNLWLSGLKSANPDLRDKARKRLVSFIQPAHIPELIETLKIPGPNVLAYEILQEVTGQKIGPDVKKWNKWWLQTHGKVDLTGHLLKDTRDKLIQRPVNPFDQDKFWYVPDGIGDAHTPYAKRSEAEQATASQWNDWANVDVKRYVDAWAETKPILDRVVHQPDPRVNKFLEQLVRDPGYGDYASVVLAWRGDRASLPQIQEAYRQMPTVGRALARGSLGDRSALVDLLRIIDRNPHALSFNIMDDTVRTYAQTLHTVGVLPAEQAFELLTHHVFDFDAAATAKEKKKSLKSARIWLANHAQELTLDRRRGYYVTQGAH